MMSLNSARLMASSRCLLFPRAKHLRPNASIAVRVQTSSTGNLGNASKLKSSNGAFRKLSAAPELCESQKESEAIIAKASARPLDEGLDRYPNLSSPGGFLRGLDYLGTVTFALTGSVAAAQSGLDMFGCCMVGTITAVGGGTIRDAIFLKKRPFWTEETEYLGMGILTAMITFFSWPSVIQWQEDRHEEKINDGQNDVDPEEEKYDEVDAVLDVFDSLGLAAFAIIGAQNGIRAGVPMVVSAICGMCTSTFGGMTRDVLCARPVRIVHSNAEVYASPALAGASMFLLAKKAGASPVGTIGSGLSLCLALRYFAIKHDLKFHTWDVKNDGLGVIVRNRTTTRAANSIQE